MSRTLTVPSVAWTVEDAPERRLRLTPTDATAVLAALRAHIGLGAAR
jgi:hypothetical protein